MASSQILLRGGPCDGRIVSADQIQGGLVAYIKCGGHYYVDSGLTRADGVHIWDDNGTAQPKPPGSGAGGTPHTHKGWSDLRHSVNVNMRKELTAAQHITAQALRSLSRSRKVRL